MYKSLIPILAVGNNNELQVIFLFVLFVIIIAAAYYVTLYISKIQQGSKRNSNLQIIEAISVGPQKSIQIVRMGKKYVVIGVTKGNIQFLQTLCEEDIVINKDIRGQRAISFGQVLSKYKKGFEGDSGENHHETKDE